MEWLGLLGAVKNTKKLSRLPELQEAASRQLLSTDPQLQAAALRCLSSFRLPFLPPHLLNFLLSLADITKLRKQGDSDREGAVADAAIDALRELSGQLGWQQYSGLLQRWLKLMRGLLRSRLHSSRDAARSVLIDLSLELGPEYLPTIVAEAKEVAAFAGKYKEAKRCRAYEAYQNLAAAVSFSTHLDLLLQLVRTKLPAATSPTVRSKLERLLMAASRGLGYNPSVTGEGLAAWIGVQLDACLRVEEAARARADGGVAGEADGFAHLYLLSHFCLNLLNSSMKKGVLAGRDPHTLLLLDPLLPLLVRALYSRHLGTVQGSLKALTVLVGHQQLPGMTAAAAAAGRALSSLLKKVPDAGHPLAQDCFKLLGAMLRDCPNYNPPTPQIRFLLRWIAADLQSGGTAASAAAAVAGSSGGGAVGASSIGERVSGYGLLRAVLGRRLLVPEVYDVMDIVQKQMMTSHSNTGRATAAAALLQFLLDYPLSPNRLQNHVAFLLTNTSYEYETGRLQALEMLQQVFLKFPQDVTVNLSVTAYLPLVMRLANETSPKARAAVAATIKLLHKQLPPAQNDQLAAISQKWLAAGCTDDEDGWQQQLLRAAAAHALGLLAEAESSSLSVNAGHLALNVYRQLEVDVVDEGLCTQAVKCLVALAKHLAAAQPQQQQQQQQQEEDGRDGVEHVGNAAQNLLEAAEDASTLERQHPEVSFLGLLVRMVKLAEDARVGRQLQRLAALRWIAAAATAVGGAAMLPHLPLLLRPLYRISEATAAGKLQQQALSGMDQTAGSTSEEVRLVSEQVLAHLRSLFGSEDMLAAYTSARNAVKSSRAARKAASSRRALLDPEANARMKLKRGKRKSEARQKKAEERRRQRAARTSGGFGFKAGVGKRSQQGAGGRDRVKSKGG
eukprot:gene8462-8646_t